MKEIDQIYEIPMDEINCDLSFNGRENADVGLEELITSIKVDGQRAAGELSKAWPEDTLKHGKKYELNAGFRRFLACRKAGLLTYKATVTPPMTYEDRVKVNVKENQARKDLNLWETTKPHVYFIEKGYTEDEIQKQLGQSRSYVQPRCMIARMVLNGITGLDTLARKNVLTYEMARDLYSLASDEDRQNQINDILKAAEDGIKVKVNKNAIATKRDRATMLMERPKVSRQALVAWCNSVGIRWNRFGKIIAWTNAVINDELLIEFFEQEHHDPTNDERLSEIFEDLESYKDNLGSLYIKLLTIKEEAADKSFEHPFNGIPAK